MFYGFISSCKTKNIFIYQISTDYWYIEYRKPGEICDMWQIWWKFDALQNLIWFLPKSKPAEYVMIIVDMEPLPLV